MWGVFTLRLGSKLGPNMDFGMRVTNGVRSNVTILLVICPIGSFEHKHTRPRCHDPLLGRTLRVNTTWYGCGAIWHDSNKSWPRVSHVGNFKPKWIVYFFLHFLPTSKWMFIGIVWFVDKLVEVFISDPGANSLRAKFGLEGSHADAMADTGIMITQVGCSCNSHSF